MKSVVAGLKTVEEWLSWVRRRDALGRRVGEGVVVHLIVGYILSSRVLTFRAIAATTRGWFVPSLFNGFLAVIFLLALLIIVIVLMQ